MLNRAFWLWSAAAVALALVVRLVLVARSGGMMEADEAVLGIQAEQILRGHLPIYFSGQSYMGSWEAYLLAPLVAVFGPSAAAMRAVQTAESLLLIPLSGALAIKLYGRRALVPALLFAAIPPLLPLSVQLRMWGGYTETLVLGTALMLIAVLIAERWDRGQSTIWLWVLSAFLVGLALWIDPLIVYYVIACALWLGSLTLARAFRRSANDQDIVTVTRQRRDWRQTTLALAAVAAAATIGAAPALYYAFSTRFSNLGILNSTKAAGPSSGFASVLAVGHYLVTHAIPDVVGVRFFWQPSAPHFIVLVLAAIAGVMLLVAALYTMLRLAAPALTQLAERRSAGRVTLPTVSPRQRWNDAFPILLGGVIVVVYLRYMYGTTPGALYFFVERYVEPLLTVLILLYARFFGDLFAGVPSFFALHARSLVRMRGMAVALLVVTLVVYAAPYALTDMSVVMRSPWAKTYSFPASHTEMLTYLEKQHIRYVWTSHWIGNVVMYLSDQRILCSDYVVIAQHRQIRFPEADTAVAAADRPSFIVRSTAPPGQSRTERALDVLGVLYHVEHFGEYLVITPLSRTVQPREIFAALAQEQ